MAIFNLSKFSLKKDPAKKEANKYLKSIKKDPQREQKLDSIQNVYNKQFDDFDMGSKVQGGEQDFDKNYNILKKAGRDTIFGMVKNPPFNVTTKNTYRKDGKKPILTDAQKEKRRQNEKNRDKSQQDKSNYKHKHK